MNTYTARQLAEILQKEGHDSINLRNIRYYREINVLKDLVEVDGKKYYTDEHLDYLRAIRTLQKTGDSLDTIKNKLADLDASQLRNLGEQMNYYTSDRVIQSVTHQFNEDISITFSHNVSEEAKSQIIKSVEKKLKK